MTGVSFYCGSIKFCMILSSAITVFELSGNKNIPFANCPREIFDKIKHLTRFELLCSLM